MKKIFQFLFNRYKREVVERGSESWYSVATYWGVPIENSKRTYLRDFVVYKITNTITGSEKIEKKYLN